MGIIEGEPDDFYHAVPGAVTSSRISTLLKSPRLWHDSYETTVTPPTGSTAALDFGRAYHCLMLEGPQALRERFAICPEFIGDKTRNPGRQAWAEWKIAAGDRPVFDYETGQVLDLMRERLLAHPVARALIEQSTHELTWRGLDRSFAVPLMFQCRTDGYADGTQKAWYGRPYILDLKTAAEDDYRSFARSFRNGRYGYHRQAAFYRGTVRLLMGAFEPSFIFIRQSKAPPYDIIIYDGVTDDALNYGAREIKAALQVLAYCRAHHVWPVASLDLGPPLDLADYVYETDPGESVAWIQRRGPEQLVRLAALAGTTPDRLLEGGAA